MNKTEKKLIKTLKSIEGNGNFLCYGKNKAIVPGLAIEGIGEIGLPVSPIMAREIIKFSTKSPVGKGNKTIYDSTARSSWEIDTKKVSFNNSEWNDFLKEVVNQAKKGLGITNKSVKASLHKFLIYEKGDFFVNHKDSEKDPEMFGTLVINLPSEHTGGELIFSFNGKTKKLNFATNKYDLPYAAFYADCNHEVKPVHSGYRINLIYNLLHDGKSKISSSLMEDKINDIAKILKQMAVEKTDVLYKAILLEHNYTPTNFSATKLKLHDQPRANVLLVAAERAGYYAKLGLITHYQMGELETDYDPYYRRGRYNRYDDYEDKDNESGEMGEVYDEHTIVEHWIGEKTPDLGSLNINESNFINDVEIGEGEPSESESEGYTGNAGMTMEYWYHYGAIILWKKNQQAEVLNELSSSIKLNWIEYFLNNWNDKLIDANTHTKQIIIDFNEKLDKNDLDFSTIIKAIKKINDDNFVKEHCVDVLTNVFDKINIENWNSFIDANPNNQNLISIFDAVGNTGYVYKINHLLKILKNTDYENATSNSLVYKQIEQIPKYITNIEFSKIKNSYNSSNYKLLDSDKVLINIIELIIEFSKTKEKDSKWINFVTTKITKNMTRAYVNNVLTSVIINKKNKGTIFNQLYDICVNDFVKRLKNKPEKLPNWTRKVPKSVNKYHNDRWEILKSFLESPTEKIFEYRKNQSYRSELEATIRSVTIDLKTTTIKKGSPHTLRITKTNAAFEKELKKWKKDEELLDKIM